MLEALTGHPEHFPTTERHSREWFSVLKVNILNATRPQAIELIEEVIHDRGGRAAWIFFVNAHSLNLASEDSSYRGVLNAADFVFADGTGVRWAARLRGIHALENLNGTDFIPALLRDTANRGYSYFLLGADTSTIATAAAYARIAFPGWTQAGFHHGYLTDDATAASAVKQINAARPDVLLVGMGNPTQEQWIAQCGAQLDVAACMGVGGLFDFWASNVSRAPRWLRGLGQEWLWRLLQQPRHKACRYLLGNPLFLARVLRERMASHGAAVQG